MNALQMQAIKKAGQIRGKLNLDMFEPINVIDACAELGISVRFLDVSMEGLYFNQGDAADPVIVLSSLRPFPRRSYTCGHELGHHVFGHGTKIDGLIEEGAPAPVYDKDEYLVDMFSGALLMPIAGIEIAFSKRKWEIHKATAIQFYTLSSMFGTGYSTLIKHCKVNGLINDWKAAELLKATPVKILQQLIGNKVTNSHFKVIDNCAELSVIDLEVGNYLFLPLGISIEGNHLRKFTNAESNDVFIAERPGILRAVSSSTGYFVRIQNAGYSGLAENRHLEDKID